MWVWSLSRGDALEKEMAAHSSILAWQILWAEGSGGLQTMGSQRDGQSLVTEYARVTLRNLQYVYCLFKQFVYWKIYLRRKTVAVRMFHNSPSLKQHCGGYWQRSPSAHSPFSQDNRPCDAHLGTWTSPCQLGGDMLLTMGIQAEVACVPSRRWKGRALPWRVCHQPSFSTLPAGCEAHVEGLLLGHVDKGHTWGMVEKAD